MIQAMQNAGIDPPAEGLVPDGKIHRYKGAHDKEKKNWYILWEEGDFSAGSFGRWSGNDNDSQTWCNKTGTQQSEHEREVLKKKQREMQHLRDLEQQQFEEQCNAWCTLTWDAAPAADPAHPYLVKKQIEPCGAKRHGDMLIIPMRRLDGSIKGMQFISQDGSKTFKTGSQLKGSMFLIGKPVDNTLIITEGYATGASIHQATGHAVLVAFVAGNLKAVVKAARAKQPSWTLIVAADNDQWAKIKDQDGNVIEYRPVPCEVDGKQRINTGVTEARKAGACRVVVPRFADLSTHPTDFNDLAILEGLETVKRQLFPPPVEEYNPDPNHTPDPNLTPNSLTKNPHFQCLGYDHGEFYYMPRGQNQVKALRQDQHTKSNLLGLAPLDWWENHFPGDRGGINLDMAQNALFRANERMKVYDIGRIRGRGAWEDDGRAVLHYGDSLMVDGQMVPLGAIDSHYCYEAAQKISFDLGNSRLPTNEAHKLFQLCDMLSWEKPINGRLLAGWCVVAPICGALSWRPHIWVTGSSGSGKSWVLENVISMALGKASLMVQGSSSEAGIRQKLMADAFPVIHDEAEGEKQADRDLMQKKLELARQASSDTGALIMKGTTSGKAQEFRIRSCFCFASIGVTASQQADNSRISVLSLVKAKDDRFEAKIKPFWVENITKEFCQGLRARSVFLLKVIRANSEVFSDAVTRLLGSKRTGDQLGALLAGSFALHSEKVLTAEEAFAWVQQQDWSEHIIQEEQTDERRCLQVIHEHIVKLDASVEMSISEIVCEVADKFCNPEKRKDYIRKLRRLGILVDNETYKISNQHTYIAKILEKTPWAIGWHRILARLPGATTAPAWFFETHRAVSLPLSYIYKEADESLPFMGEE